MCSSKKEKFGHKDGNIQKNDDVKTQEEEHLQAKESSLKQIHPS